MAAVTVDHRRRRKVAGQVELAGDDLADDEADHAEYGGADEGVKPAHDPGEAQQQTGEETHCGGGHGTTSVFRMDKRTLSASGGWGTADVGAAEATQTSGRTLSAAGRR